MVNVVLIWRRAPVADGLRDVNLGRPGVNHGLHDVNRGERGVNLGIEKSHNLGKR